MLYASSVLIMGSFSLRSQILDISTVKTCLRTGVPRSPEFEYPEALAAPPQFCRDKPVPATYVQGYLAHKKQRPPRTLQ